MIILFTLLESNNPYKVLGIQNFEGLTTIESSLTPNMEIFHVVTLVAAYVESVYFPTSSDAYTNTEIMPIVYNGIDIYKNGNLNTFSPQQLVFIERLIIGLRNSPPNQLREFIENYNTQVLDSSMSLQEKAPILFASAIANTSALYWTIQIENPASPWYTNLYFSTNEYENYISISNWTIAGVIGALSSANLAANYGQLDPPRIIGVDLVSCLSAALGASLSAVILKYNRI